jgi:predicted dehydrogenase
MKIRTAVIGVGHLGRIHAQKHKMLDQVQLVGVCDVQREQAATVGREMGVDAFFDPKDLLGKVDAVTIAASTVAHFELAQLFLKNDVHVMVEKPIASTADEGERLCEIAEQRGLKFYVGHVERFNPALQAARSKIGKPLFLEVHRLAPFKVRSTETDVVLDLMIHDLDVILSLVGSEPVSVAAVGARVLTQKMDIANARIEFASGAVANVTASRVSVKSERKFRLFQADQYLSVDFQSGEVNLFTKTGDWVEGNDPPIEHESFNLERGDALLDETRAFFNAVGGETPEVAESAGHLVGVSGRDGLKALRLAEKIVTDARKHFPVLK